jgi:hypothetical protein
LIGREKDTVMSDEKTKGVIPLAEHQQPSYYVNCGERWPSFQASHVRLNNGKLVHLEKHIQNSIARATSSLSD